MLKPLLVPRVLLMLVAGAMAGCPNPGAGTTGNREASRASIGGRVRLASIPGLNDFSRVRVDLGRGEGGVAPDENGDFSVSDLEPDVYTLTLTYIGGLTPEASRSAYKRLTTRVVARAGGDINVGELRPELATGTVSGTVPVVMGGPMDNPGGANVKLVLSSGETRTVVTAADGSFTVPDVPVGSHAVSVSKAGFARAPGEGGCVPSVKVIQEDDPAVAQGLALAPTAASFEAGQGQVWGSDNGTTWFVRGSELTVNGIAGYARRARHWKQGEPVPSYDTIASPGLPSFPLTELVPGTQVWNFQLADGCDSEGYESPVTTLTLVRDTEPPTVLRAELGAGAPVLTDPATTLLLLAQDALSPTMEMRTLSCRGTASAPTQCSPAADFSSETNLPWVPYASSVAVNLPAQEASGDDGARVVLVQLRDLSQNTMPTPAAAEVRVDSQPPDAPVVTPETDGAGTVFSTQVRVALSVPADAVQMRLSVDGVAQAWRAVDVAATVSLSAEDGTKLISAVVRDAVGRESAPGTATVTLRTRGSVVGTVTLADGGGRFGPLSGTDGASLGARVRLSQNTDAGPVLETTADAEGRYVFAEVPAGSWTLRADGPEGGRAYRSQTRDVQVVPGQPTPSVDVVLALLTGQLSGSVLLEGTSDASAATVFVEETRAGGRVLALPVRANGAFGPESVPLGNWRGRAAAPGYAAATLGTLTLQTEDQDAAFDPAVLNRVDSGGVRIQGAPYTGSINVTLLVDVAGATGIRASESTPVSGAFDGLPASGQYAFTLSPADGLKTVYVELQTPAGVRAVQAETILDRTPPRILQLRVNGGEAFTRTANVPITLTAVDDVTSVRDMRFTVGGVVGSTRRYAEVSEVVLSGADGPFVVSATVTDQADNPVPTPTETTLFLDTRAPVPGVVTVQGAVGGSVRDTDVVLLFNATDACLTTATVVDPRACPQGGTTPPHQLLISERADFAGAAWQPYAATLLHRLSPADGDKTLFVRFRDRAGNEASAPPLTLQLDRTAPTQAALVLAGGAFFTSSRAITAAPTGLGFSRFHVGVTESELAAAPLIPFAVGVTAPVTLPDQDGVQVVLGELVDDAGNRTRVEGRITLDRVAPTVILTVVEGTLTRTPDIHLRVVAVDANGLAPLPMQIANGPILPNTPALTYSPALLDWSLHAPASMGPDGDRTVTVRVRDSAGNTADASAVIRLDATPPVAPASPTATARAGRFPSAGGGLIAAGGRTNDAFPTLAWGASADATAYRVEMSTGLTFSTVARTATFTGVRTTLPFVLEDGPWSWRVVAVDAAGNEATAPGTSFTVDTIPPAAPSLTLEGGVSSTTDATVSAVATTPDPPTGLTLVLTGDLVAGTVSVAPFPVMPFNLVLTGTDGDKTIQAVVRDDAGNESTGVTRTVRLRLDTTAPQVSVVQVGDGSGFVADAQGVTTLTVDCSDNLAPDVDLDLIISEGGTMLYSGAYLPVAPITLGPAETTHTLTAQCRDPAGNTASATSASVVVDRTPPSVSSVAMASGAAATNSAIVQVTYTASDAPASGQPGPASGVAALAFGFASFACANGSFTAPPAGPVVLTLPGTDGLKNLFVCARDAAGNLASANAVLADTITLDRVAPASFAFVLNGGSAYSPTAAVTASATTADTPATGYRVTITGQLTADVSVAPSGSIPLSLTSGSGPRTVTAVLTDEAGNASAPVVRTVTVDNAAPTVASVAINGGAAHVTTAGGITTVDVSCADAAAPSNLLTLRVTDAADSSVLFNGVYAARVPITLGTTAGTRTVSATCTDPAGNTSSAVTDSVLVDLLPPTVSALTIAGTAGTLSASSAVQVNYTLSDGANGSGAFAVALSESTPFNCTTASYTYPSSGPVAFTLSAGDGTRRVYLCARDAAGNVTPTASVSNDLTVDTQADGSGTLTLAGGARATSSLTVPAVVAGRPSGSSIRVGGDVSAPTTDRTTDTFNVTLRSGDGPKTVFMQFVDAVGNVGTIFSYTITLDTQPPALAAFNVGAGTGFVSDPNGITTAEVSCSDAQTPSGQLLLTITETSAMPMPVQRYNSTYLPVVTLPLTSTESTRTLRATCTDLAGNTAASGTSVADVTVVVDRSAPVLSAFAINSGAAATNNPLVSLTYTTSDTGGSGVLGVAVGTVAFSCSTATYALGTTGGSLALSGADGSKDVYACVRDRAGNVGAITSSLAASIVLDRVAPQNLSFTVQGGASFVGSTSVTLAASTTDAPSTGYRLRINGDLSAPVDVLLASAPATLTLSAGEGTKTLSAELVDAAGNALPVPVVRTITLDTTGPVVTRVALNGGSPFVNASGGSTTVAVGCSDLRAPTNLLSVTVRDVVGMGVLFSGAFSENIPVTLGATSQGTRNVLVTCTDPAGNASAGATDPDGVFVDTVAPSIGTFTLNGGTPAEPTASSIITVNASVTDGAASSGLEYALMEAGSAFACAGAAYGPLTPALPVDRDPDRTIRLYLCARDRAGNVAGANATASTNTVVLDTVAPAPGTLTLAGGASSLRVRTGVAAALTGFAGLNVVLNGDIEGAPITLTPAVASTTVNLLAGDGLKLVTGEYVDGAGNTSRVFQDSVVLDTVPPTVSVQVAPNAPVDTTTGLRVVTTNVVDVQVAARDADTMALWDNPGPTATCGNACTRDTDCTAALGETCVAGFCGQACSSANYEPFDPATTFTFSTVPGEKTLCYQFCDNAGNANQAASSRVKLKGNRPRPTISAITVLAELTTPSSCTSGLECGTGGQCTDGRCWAPSAPGNVLVSLSAPRFRLAATGTGMAADSRLVVGDFTLVCAGGDPQDDCAQSAPGTCGTTCESPAPTCKAADSSGCLQDEVTRNAGVYAVRLLTPDPVQGGLGESSETELLYVRSPAPELVKINVRGVTNAPSGPTEAIVACTRKVTDNAEFRIGAAAGLGSTCNAAEAAFCATGDQCWHVDIKPYGQADLDLVDYTFEVSNPAPGGGAASLPFGINPHPSDCPLSGTCASNLRGTRAVDTAVTGVFQGYGLDGIGLSGVLGWSGGSAASVARGADRFHRQHAGGYLRIPLLSRANRVYLESNTLNADTVRLRPILTNPTGLPVSTDVPFADKATISAGPADLVMGDLDQNGLPDLVTVGYSSLTVSVLRRMASGQAMVREDYATVATPRRVLLTDLNRDGFQDVVTCPETDSAVEYRLNSGDGRLESRRVTQVGTMPGVAQCRAMVAGDVNRDGVPDVVVAAVSPGNGSKQRIFTLLADGKGGLTPTSTAGTDITLFAHQASITEDLLLEDVNHDGWLDLVVVGALSTTAFPGTTYRAYASFLLGGVNGFVSATASNTLPMHVGMAEETTLRRAAMGDLNNDGVRDLVATHTSSLVTPPGRGVNDALVVLHLGTVTAGGAVQAPGTGVGAAPTVVRTGATLQFRGPVGLALADMDLDGNLDVVVAKAPNVSGPPDNQLVEICRGTGVASSPTTCNPAALGAGSTQLLGHPMAVVVGDLNASPDGIADVAFLVPSAFSGASSASSQVWVRRMAADIGLSHGVRVNPFASEVFGLTTSSPDVQVAHLNTGNGAMLVSLHGRDIHVQNPSDSSISQFALPPFPPAGTTYPLPVRLAVGQLDGDPNLYQDVVVAAPSGGGSPGVFLVPGAGGGVLNVTPGVTVQLTNNPARDVAVADVNMDGKMDVLFLTNATTTQYRRLGVLVRNVADTGFDAVDGYTLDPTAVEYTRLAVGDINGDGHVDVVALRQTTAASTAVAYVLGAGPSGSAGMRFAPAVSPTLPGLPATHATNTLVLADVTADGRAEIMLSHTLSGAGALRVFDPATFPNFTVRTTLTSGVGGAFDVADLNGDAVPELVTQGIGGEVSFRRGTTDLSTFATEGPLLISQPGANRVRLVDLDGDGARDLEVDNPSENAMKLWVSDTPGAVTQVLRTGDFPPGTITGRPAQTVAPGGTLDLPFDAVPTIVSGVSVRLRVSGADAGFLNVSIQAPGEMTSLPIRRVSPACGGSLSSNEDKHWTSGNDCDPTLDSGAVLGVKPAGNWRLILSNTSGTGTVTIEDAELTVRGWHQRETPGHHLALPIPLGGSTYVLGTNAGMGVESAFGSGKTVTHVVQVPTGKTTVQVRATAGFQAAQLDIRSSTSASVCSLGTTGTTLEASDTTLPLLATPGVTAGTYLCIRVSSNQSIAASGVGPYALSVRFP